MLKFPRLREISLAVLIPFATKYLFESGL